ncbi:response regulator [Novosphingobium resinovorum]
MILEPHAMDLHTRILIVGDDEGIRSLIGDFLAKHGYDATTAADPLEMRKLLASESFDLIVLDVMMPREDGLTALRQLGPDAPPVIMLSAVGSDVDRIVGLEMGADDYLAKPCNPRELLARIRTVLRRRAGPRPPEHWPRWPRPARSRPIRVTVCISRDGAWIWACACCSIRPMRLSRCRMANSACCGPSPSIRAAC